LAASGWWGVYARWVGSACAACAVLVLAGDLLMLAAEVAFLAVLVGFLLFLVVLIALGVAMWQQAALSTSTAAEQGAAAGGGSAPMGEMKEVAMRHGMP